MDCLLITLLNGRCLYCRDLMLSNSRLTVPILDVLTNLNLTADLLAQVRAVVSYLLH